MAKIIPKVNLIDRVRILNSYVTRMVYEEFSSRGAEKTSQAMG